MGLIALALAGVLALGLPGSPAHKSVKQGLDLQGGLEVDLKAVPPKGQKVESSKMRISQNIMRNRVDKLGVSEPEVRLQGGDQIVIQLAGVHDPKAAASLIGKTAQLEFFDLEADVTGPSRTADSFPVATPTLYTLLSRAQSLTEDKGAASWYLFDSKTKKVVVGPLPTRDSLFTTKKAKKPKPKTTTGPPYRAFGVPNGTTVISCGGGGAVVCPGAQEVNPTKTYWYLFKYDPDGKNNDLASPEDPIPEMTGRDLKLSGTRADVDPNQGPIVLMQFTNHGADVFHDITRREAQFGRIHSRTAGQKVEGHLAIVLDREIRSWPSDRKSTRL